MKPVLRDATGRYLPGSRPGPGRPKDSRPRLITALTEALDDDATLERLRRVAIEQLEQGNVAMWRLFMDRLWPARLELGAETEHVVEFRWAGKDVWFESEIS